MRHDQSALYEALDFGYMLLAKPKTSAFKLPRVNITSPAVIRQELAFTNATNPLRFEFGSNARAPTAVLNNIRLGENDVFAMVGIMVEYGIGANANTRQYAATGNTNIDDSLYNGELSVQFESNKPIAKMPMSIFREEGQKETYSGLVLDVPRRVFSGRLSSLQLEISLPNITGLAITPNSFPAVSLFGVLGQAGSPDVASAVDKFYKDGANI